MADDENVNPIMEESADIAPFDPSKKKKKKKVVIQESFDEPVDKLVETTDNSSVTEVLDTAIAWLVYVAIGVGVAAFMGYISRVLFCWWLLWWVDYSSPPG